MFCCCKETVYSYKYIDDWKIINETSLPEKKCFCSHLNMKDITNVDYKHAKILCKDFEIEILNHDVYV